MTGLVLAGGRSVRFGSDKSRFVLPGESRDMLRRTLEMLGSVAGVTRLAVACRSEQADDLRGRLPSHVALITDGPHEISSPFYGVMAALRALDAPLLALSCDLPLMRADVLSLLVRTRSEVLEMLAPRQHTPLRTTFIHPDGRVETLVSIYEREALPFLEGTQSAGRRGLFSAIPLDRQTLIPCPEEPPFLNMNTPDCLALRLCLGQEDRIQV